MGAPIYRGTAAGTEATYLTDAFAREAVSFIEQHKNDPFFLYLAFNAVHTPMHATDLRLRRFASITDERRRTYAGDAHRALTRGWAKCSTRCGRPGSNGIL